MYVFNHCVCFIYACFSININVVIVLKEFSCPSDYPTLFVLRPQPGPMRIGYEGFYCSTLVVLMSLACNIKPFAYLCNTGNL